MMIGNTYVNSHYGQLTAAHSAAPVALFMRAGDNYDLAYSAPARQHTQALAAGGPLERVLSGHPGPVPVERVRGSAYILGQRLNAAETQALAAVGADFLVALGAPGHLDALLCLSTVAVPDVRRFPAERPHIRDLDYHSDWRAAGGPSGDYLDCFELPEGQLGLAIGDVAGQDFSTALLTSSLHGIARALRSSQFGSLSQLMRTIDEVFCEVCPGNSYATLFFARCDPHRGTLHYVNAGHESPVLLRKTATDIAP